MLYNNRKLEGAGNERGHGQTTTEAVSNISPIGPMASFRALTVSRIAVSIGILLMLWARIFGPWWEQRWEALDGLVHIIIKPLRINTSCILRYRLIKAVSLPSRPSRMPQDRPGPSLPTPSLPGAADPLFWLRYSPCISLTTVGLPSRSSVSLCNVLCYCA